MKVGFHMGGYSLAFVSAFTGDLNALDSRDAGITITRNSNIMCSGMWGGCHHVMSPSTA